MRFVLTLIRILVDALFGLIMCRMYYLGMELSVTMLKIDLWFVKFTFGVLGIGIALMLFSWAKHFLFYLFKCLDVSLITAKSNAAESVSFATLFSMLKDRFGSVILIPVFNKVIRTSLSELGDAFLDSMDAAERSGNVPIADIVYGTVRRMDNTMLATISKFGKDLLVKIFDYADECVLSYCFKHRDNSLANSAIKALYFFIKNMDKFIPKMFSLCIGTFCIKFVSIVACLVMLYSTFGFSSINDLLLYYFVLYAFSFVVEDAIIEPLTMGSIIKQFAECDSETRDITGEAFESIKQEIYGFLPSLEGLERISSTKG